MAKKNAAAISLGRLGGRARARALTSAQRSAIARRAVQTRWRGFAREIEAYRKAHKVRYLTTPRTPQPPSRVVVHNKVIPASGGFRAWAQLPDGERLLICRCGWAPWLGAHYRIRSTPLRKSAK